MSDKSTIEECIEKNGFYLATVEGTSMMPMLRQGIDMVKIVKPPKELKKYDVPLFKRPTGEYVLHRIVAVKKDKYLICGDNRVYKEPVPKEWIVGYMESFFRAEKEISVDNEEYMKYVKKTCKQYWKRKISRIIKKCLHSK